ncbi:MAG: hypothetical protein IT537_22960 [Hyphomicrobiales bacterium]|nr:hypothetical protein [Hyphomicrobiales bacterium]
MPQSSACNLSDVRAACDAGRPDEALARLLDLLQAGDQTGRGAVGAAVEAASAAARSVATVDALHRELGWPPLPWSPAAPGLGPDLLRQLREEGTIGLLRMHCGKGATRDLVDLHAADMAVACGDAGRAAELLTALPREQSPVPWHLLSGRVAILRGDPAAALDALMIPLALRPHIPEIYEAIAAAMRLVPQLPAGGVEPMLAAAAARSRVDWLSDSTMSAIPLPWLRRYSRWVVLPALQTSVALFLQRAAELHSYMLLARKSRDLVSAIKHRKWRLLITR